MSKNLSKNRNKTIANLINYKAELEQAAKEMVLIHDPKKLIRQIVDLLVQKIKLKHAAVLIYDNQKNTYVLTVSGGEKGLKIPEGYARIDPQNSLIKLFATRKNRLFGENGIITYQSFETALKNRSLLNREEGLAETLLDTKRQMEIYNASVCLPIYVQNKELLGILMLGKKQSAEKFTKKELDFFAALASDIAMAVKNAQLHELEIKAEKLAGMTNLLDSLHHEFRNQINTVEFFMKNYDKPEYQEEMKNYRRIALESFEIMLMILDSVQSYRETAEIKEISYTSLKETIDSSFLGLKDKFTKINVKITKDIAQDLPKIETYPSFQYVFFNILMNCYYALAAQKNTRLLEIKACQTKDSQRPIEIVVKDTGGDMTRVMKEEAPSSGGKEFPERSRIGGINYFLAKHIIEDHQGELVISANLLKSPAEQKGTIFTIKLPLTQPKK